MTDKQIIIDGVDVSGCKHFKNATCIADYLLTDMNFSEAKCELCKNCYYKQLKRKEQEGDKYKQTRIDIIRFLKEDKKFARYSCYPIVLTSIVLEEIEKILKENDIKISEVKND